MPDEFAEVLSCWSVEEAHLARLHLASEGIEARLSDDQTVGMDWALANAMRGVKVLVKSEDADSARQVLDVPPHVELSDEGCDSWANQSVNSEQNHEAVDDVGFQDEEHPDEDLAIGRLDTYRSIKVPVILLILAPMLIAVLMAISTFVAWGMQRIGGW